MNNKEKLEYFNKIEFICNSMPEGLLDICFMPKDQIIKLREMINDVLPTYKKFVAVGELAIKRNRKDLEEAMQEDADELYEDMKGRYAMFKEFLKYTDVF